MRRATCVGREELSSLGQNIGKFTHSGKFRISIGALDLLAKYAKFKVYRYIHIHTLLYTCRWASFCL